LLIIFLFGRFEDIIDLQVDDIRRQLCLQTRQGPQVVLRSEHAHQIRALVEKLMTGSGGKVRTFVRAITDYITNEPNLLSFSKGDIIQIISRDDGTLPVEQDTGQWLYGRIGNHFGNLSANYVEPLDTYGRVINFLKSYPRITQIFRSFLWSIS
uniref:SH3 domain-containing protein n=1 Tax=Gongylonema pulchrum TaxID=637853 RepID=A0A183EIG9_9BILA